jgi:hypothetical protein
VNIPNYLLPPPLPMASLVWFRLVFGSVLLVAVLRYFIFGWINRYYLEPTFFFSLYPFHWLPAPNAFAIYAIFCLLLLASLAIILGYHYRKAVFLFFLGFSYIELLDFTHYLNHHYLLWLLLILAFFLPANAAKSLDVIQNRVVQARTFDARYLYILRFQLCCVYFFAGVAKLNADWLVQAQPLTIWLARQADFPVLGGILAQPITAMLMSWAGAIFDLSAGFLLLFRPSRIWAYLAVVGFHLLTYALFNIGIFPFIMIALATLFFAPEQHQRWVQLFVDFFIYILSKLKLIVNFAPNSIANVELSSFRAYFFLAFAFVQILLPLRCFWQGENVLWDETGFRFSWRVMLIEKSGQAVFTVIDADTGQESQINNREFLTDKQEVMMQTQADFILHFAHYVARHYADNKGYSRPIVRVNCRVALNGRRSYLFLPDTLDLAKIPISASMQTWIVSNQ